MDFPTKRTIIFILAPITLIFIITYFALNFQNEYNHFMNIFVKNMNNTLKSVSNKSIQPNDSTQNESNYYNQWFGSCLLDFNFKIQYENICNLPDLIFIKHHKTGGYMKSWVPYLKNVCNMTHQWSFQYNPNTINTSKTKLNRSKYFLWSEKNHKQNDFFKLTQTLNGIQNEGYIVIMMVREPLTTILSGYNYHAAGREIAWTNKKLNAASPHRPMSLLSCFKNVFNSNETVIDGQSTMYKEYRKGFANQYANEAALQYGLYLEFTRYSNCEYPQIYAFYRGIKYNEQIKYFLFLRFEWFQTYDYDQSVKYMLDSLGIDQNIYNKRLLPGLLNENVQTKRKNGKTLSHISKVRGHSTYGTYNKDLQIDLLLKYNNNTNVCLFIKNMTLLLDSKWYYQQYC